MSIFVKISFIFKNYFFLLSVDFFFKLSFSKNYCRNTIRVSNSLDPDQAQHLVRPDLGPNCLRRLSSDNILRQNVKVGVFCGNFKANY